MSFMRTLQTRGNEELLLAEALAKDMTLVLL